LNNQEQIGLKEIEEKNKLISSYAKAQYEFEKIVGLEEAIKITTETKKRVLGHGYLSDASNSALVELLAKLRYLYAHVVKKQ
jgi:hypothetical protein